MVRLRSGGHNTPNLNLKFKRAAPKPEKGAIHAHEIFATGKRWNIPNSTIAYKLGGEEWRNLSSPIAAQNFIEITSTGLG